MRCLAVLLLLVAVMLVLGCTTTQFTATTQTTASGVTTTATTATTPVTTVPEPAAAPQLENDTFFTYRADILNLDYLVWKNGSTSTEQVLGQSLIAGQAAYCIKTVPDTDSPELYTYSYFTVDGYRMLREKDYSGSQLQWYVDYDPAITMGFPLQHGSPQNFSSDAERHENGNVQQATVNYTLTVEYAGAVEVPAGTYDCYLVTQFFPDTNVTFLRHYSAEVGFFVSSQVFAGVNLIEQTELTSVY